jgi:hypothetical protein
MPFHRLLQMMPPKGFCTGAVSGIRERDEPGLERKFSLVDEKRAIPPPALGSRKSDHRSIDH